MTEDSKPRKSHLTFLEKVRACELDAASRYLPASEAHGISCRLLEIGAGTGVQAQRLSELGYAVSALEVHGSSYRNVRCVDIVEYDGINIPFPDRSYDVVFSSHVLEHVLHLDELLGEMHRVLSDGGTCIHVVPTPSCRAWSLLAHYIWLAKRVIQKMTSVRGSDTEDGPRTPNTLDAWLWTVFPPRHGERGNTVTEIYYYSRRFWRKKFEKNNFNVIHIDSNDFFYSMSNALGSVVSMKKRRFLARFFGSGCNIYVLKKKDSN